ncbi:helix-turn-helix transcriptional regulator [Qipengyuania flava]|uniref:helix-turn-helix transcriptional regulator n=1 Tax=Qipengyuania flava TaxID=192812 RepID=UPI001C639832|nr:helix-turn-helix transcriptional regulator [Qipengyuania flava]QYJ06880.1 helix-turn-helix transcriptional regulator [Qipengyuania flava]
MRIPNLGETELLVPLHSGMFEQPMWLSFLRQLRRACAADSVMIRISGAGESEDITLRDGDPLDLGKAGMRDGRVYSGAEIGSTAETLRAIRVEAEALSLTLAVHAPGAPGAELASLLSALAPHLRVALRVLASLERERSRASVSAEAFRRMNFGWIAIDERCRIVDCDPQAQRFLERSGALRKGPYDRLIPSAPAVDRQLTALAKAMAADRRHRPRAINISQDPWIDILVAPMRLDALAGEGRAVAVVYLRGDRSSSADRHEQLVDLFDLTPAEARLAWSLAQGLSIAEAAEAHGLTLETARYYSKKIYAKTGARGQVDLVRNILTGVLALA